MAGDAGGASVFRGKVRYGAGSEESGVDWTRDTSSKTKLADGGSRTGAPQRLSARRLRR